MVTCPFSTFSSALLPTSGDAPDFHGCFDTTYGLRSGFLE
jgi:hypothetical protein